MAEDCAGNTKSLSSGSNFSLSFCFLPKEKRSAIRTIYSFCRIVDDIVDQAVDLGVAEKDLARWQGEVEACYRGQPTIPLASELAETVKRFSIPKEPLLEIIEGVWMDLSVNRYRTFSDLRKYCDRVAGAVGLVCMRVFGPVGREPDEYALNLGCALQVINICRDVGTDADRGRIYVPLEDLEKYKVTEEDILQKQYSSSFVELMKSEAARAREFLSRADVRVFGSDRMKVLPAEIMSGVYGKLLDNIESREFRVFDKRIRVNAAQKTTEVLKAWFRCRF